MGVCSSIEASHKERARKILLLGAGEAGKTTLFKQLSSIFGETDERDDYAEAIRIQVINSINFLISNCEDLAVDNPEEYQIHPDVKNAVTRVKALYGTDCERFKWQDKNTSGDIRAIWSDSAVQKAYRNRVEHEVQVAQSIEYFANRISDIGFVKYIPTNEDILMLRVRTTGIVNTEIEIKNEKIKLVDIGGQLNERKKWKFCFENLSAVVFVVALSEYDQVMFENESMNRMDDALALFGDICKYHLKSGTKLIVVFNKLDLFLEKINNVPLTACPVFKDTKGFLNNPDKALDCIISEFEKVANIANPEAEFKSMVTTALHRKDVETTFVKIVKYLTLKSESRGADDFGDFDAILVG